MAIGEISQELDFCALADEYMGEGGLFVYERAEIDRAAQPFLEMKMPYGLTPRYAVKANPHPDVVRHFDELGFHFDASSPNEAEKRLTSKGVEGSKVSLSSQVLRQNEQLERLLAAGVLPVATSLRQIAMLGDMGCKDIAVRINPGKGYGGNNRTNVGGSESPFGIWHEFLPEVINTAAQARIRINRLHTHIGSGARSDVWRKVMRMSLAVVEQLPEVGTIDIGGGYKVARVLKEAPDATDIAAVGKVFAEELEAFADQTGRELSMEVEPGTSAVANAGTLLGRVEEIKPTDTYQHLVLNVGMNANLRPSHYGSQHPIRSLSNAEEYVPYTVFGPACESGDTQTVAKDDPETLQPRRLRRVEVGDYIAIGGVGAYGKIMGAVEYNDIPAPTEIVV